MYGNAVTYNGVIANAEFIIIGIGVDMVEKMKAHIMQMNFVVVIYGDVI